MVELDVTVEGARFEAEAATPLMMFAVRATNRTPELRVQNLALTCQIRIEPTGRSYAGAEQARLADLFGEPERWGETLHGFLWTFSSATTPPFDVDCRIELPAPCSCDFAIAATKYFQALEGGTAPLRLLFSGSVFYRDAEGRLQIGQIPWRKEASFRLPAALWRSMMDHHYAEGAWLQLDHALVERLGEFRRSRGLRDWNQALEALLAAQLAPQMAPQSEEVAS
jgi:hypothetical protein